MEFFVLDSKNLSCHDFVPAPKAHRGAGETLLPESVFTAFAKKFDSPTPIFCVLRGGFMNELESPWGFQKKKKYKLECGIRLG
jgi:hypothetical protein